jgi:hypothetical protein
MKSKRKLLTPVPPNPPRRRACWRKWFLIGLVVYAILGFFILPALVKWQLRQQLPALTQRVAEVKQVRMNPFALSLTVRGLMLAETNGTPFAGFDELYVNFQLSSVFRWAWTFGEIRVVHPTANIVRRADGSFNFSNLIKTNSSPDPNPPAGLPAIIVHALHVTNAVVTFADQATPQPFHTVYGPINIALADFTTRPAKDGPYTFVATTGDGETFSWSGQVSVNPPQSTGRFMLTGIPPAKYGPYLAQFATVRLQSGKLDLGANYRLNAARLPLELEVTNATVELRDLVVQPPEADITLLALNHFLITNASASLTGQVARVGLVALEGGSVLVGRETNGQPSILSYLVPQTNKGLHPAAPEPNAVSPAAPAPWQVFLDELAITNFNVAVADHSTEPVAELGVDQLALNVKGLSNQTNTPLQLALSFDWRGGGHARIDGRGTLQPPNLAATLAITNLALAPLQPYVGQYLNLVVHSGGVSVDGTAEFNPAGAPQLHFAGDVGVTNFATSDTVAYHELASWDNQTVRGIDLSLKPNRLTVAEVKFTGARNNFVISSNRVLNVVALPKLPPARTNESTGPATPDAAKADPLEQFPIRVALLILENNSLRVADDSLPRRFETHIEEINGSVRDIALPGANRAAVDIRGKVSALAPFEIVGEVTPDPKHLFVDLKVAFTNTDLTSLSAYTENFVGRPLHKGRLTMELRHHIADRQLTAQNVIALDHLTLGARNDSPNATRLPVKLAIGLLKDLNGRIELNLPITGSLDDPKFSIWGLVGQTFQNLILKVATSPFSLLGALVGGGEELQFVEFNPGQATLNDNQTNRLMKLTKALAERPALGLEIGASFDANTDVDALGRQKVAGRMKALRLEELVARGKTAPPLSELILDDDDYDRLLRKSYLAAFNTTPERALREALAAAVATNAPGSAALPATAAPEKSQKGAAALMNLNNSLTQLAAKAPPPASGAPSVAATKPKTEREWIRDEMEQRLATTMPVTTDEIRALLQRRIEVVQRFLADPGGISGERVLATAPQPENPSRQGAARVVFSLD